MAEKTKQCKYCKSEIDKDAKICPNCGKKQKGGIGKIVLIVIACLVVLFLVLPSGDDSGSSSFGGSTSTQEEKITYEKHTAKEMLDLLNENAAKAEKEYQDKYVSVTGKVNVIDSDLSYIAIGGSEYDIINITCNVNGNEDIENKVLDLKVGSKVTVKGQVTEIGEVLGYTMDIDSISVKE